MKLIQPKVALIATTSMLDSPQFREYFQDLGIPEYNPFPIDQGPVDLITFCGKQCYRSFEPGLNPNVTKIRTDVQGYLNNIFDQAHGSVLEFVDFTFLFWYVSRVYTHELVRHRVGSAFAQESLRYVRLEDLNFYMPEALKGNEEGEQYICRLVETLEQAQKDLAQIYGIDQIGEFSIKKKLTSGFRRVAPIGLGTSIVFKTNLRNLRHVVQMRTDRSAEEEIRFVFGKVMHLAIAANPMLWSDFDCRFVDGFDEWSSQHASTPYDQRKLKAEKASVTALQEDAQFLRQEIDDLKRELAARDNQIKGLGGGG